MNEALRNIAIDAGAPEEVIDTLWFNVFCQNFAHLLLLMAEQELEQIGSLLPTQTTHRYYIMIEQFAKEFWTRVCEETKDIEPDQRYFVRGVVWSVLHDMKESYRVVSAANAKYSDITSNGGMDPRNAGT